MDQKQMETAKLQFNIIFTPNTVEYLSPLIHSLLKWTDCRYRIVNNGCGPKEQALLEDFCTLDPRLEYLTFSTTEMLEHGLVLNWLLERTESPWFCFMDSDILATGPYLETIVREMQNHQVFSTGLPLWYSPADISLPRNFRRLHGIHFNIQDDKPLGGTYFTVYDKQHLLATMQATGVDLRIYQWEKVPERHRETLLRHGLEKIEYDTGKLLMSLMFINGTKFAWKDIAEVCHLGGFSSRAEDEPEYYFRGKFDQVAVNFLGGKFAGPLFNLADSWYAFSRTSPGVSPDESSAMPFAERRLIEARIRKRRNTARYFKALMQSLLAASPPPAVPVLGYAPAEQRMASASVAIRGIYKSHPPKRL